MNQLVKKSRDLMKRQTIKNGAPAWGLTEISVACGAKFAKKYKVDPNLVVASLYLAHSVYSTKIGGSIQKNHAKLSASYVEPYLKKWKVPAVQQEIILNAIRAHHGQVPTKSFTAEVMKNAECFKFLTLKGALIYLHDLGHRGEPFDRAIDQVKHKMKQKFSYLTFPDTKQDATRNYKAILKVLDSL